MLSAMTSNGQRIYQLGTHPIYFDEPLFCPFCHARVHLRSGSKNRPHFAHCKKESCDFQFENESEEHLTLKTRLFETLKSCVGVEIEVSLKQGRQIADLLVEDALALEVQCSQLSLSRLKERNQGYKKQGVRVIWLLGKNLWLKKHVTKLQDQLLNYSRELGYYYWELDYKKLLIRLKYLIHEDMFHHIVYLHKEWSLSDVNLHQILIKPESFLKQRELKVNNFPDFKAQISRQLYFRQKDWMKRQAQLYLKGRNILLEPDHYFWPYYRPLSLKSRFCCSFEEQRSAYIKFVSYYKSKKIEEEQLIFPPSFF